MNNTSPKFKSSVTPDQLKNQAKIASDRAASAAVEAQRLQEQLSVHEAATERLVGAKNAIVEKFNQALAYKEKLGREIADLEEKLPDQFVDPTQWHRMAVFLLEKAAVHDRIDIDIAKVKEQIAAAEQAITDFLGEDAQETADAIKLQAEKDSVAFSERLRQGSYEEPRSAAGIVPRNVLLN